MGTDTRAVVAANPIEAHRDLIRRTIAPTVSADEFDLFMARCIQTGLDPIGRQIYAIARYDRQAGGNKMSIQVSIDGMRLLAERSGKYAGQLGPFWCGEDGEWKEIWLSNKAPRAAKVGVLRSDFKEPLWAVAKYESYVQNGKDGNPTTMWAKMADLMLGKCAESLALRRAFPAETSGLYTREEMQQADNQDGVIEGQVTASEVVTEAPKSVVRSAQENKPASAKPAETPVAATNGDAQPTKANRAVSTPQSNPEVNRVKNHAISLDLVHNLAEWMAYKENVLGKQVRDSELTEQQIATLRAAIDVDRQPVTAGK